jgi:hypothetical protein
MNIIWQYEVTLKPCTASGEHKEVKVNPQDLWADISLSEPTTGLRTRTETTDITKNGKVFRNIPTHLYMIVN